MDENKKYITIKKLIETDGSKERAAINLSCTIRHINRMIKGYKEKGKEYFVHGNRGKKPIHTLENKTKIMILDLYRTKMQMQISLITQSYWKDMKKLRFLQVQFAQYSWRNIFFPLKRRVSLKKEKPKD